jgi:hypothetical protein
MNEWPVKTPVCRLGQDCRIARHPVSAGTAGPLGLDRLLIATDRALNVRLGEANNLAARGARLISRDSY